MSETSGPEAKKRSRLRWVTLGEAIAIAALIVSALGLWHELKKPDDKPVITEQRSAIPLSLRGTIEDDGKTLVIAPVEPSHSLEYLNLAIKGSYPLETDGSGKLRADYVKRKLKKAEDEGEHSVRVRVNARYIEMGKERTATGYYVLRYRWESGGLLGGRSLRLVRFSRS